ncbi:MAG: ABC transporter ATP-binding protein [Candidatus Heimdallarchaeota archaeon]|nr:ABC transporter ATP-binding protein [Candidatus Heimdallarchaeota archaeon]
MTDNNTILSIEKMVKEFGTFRALDEFSAEIPSGVTGLLGPNGAGKTTFIRCLLGIYPYSSGGMTFLNHKLPDDLLKVKDLFGYQPEVDTKIRSTTAARYVTHMGILAGLPRNVAKQRAFDTLHYVGLEEARYRDMNTFSQGMMQKVKLATALVHDPQLLILDEPTAGCDPQSHEQILDLIYDLGKNHGKNIIISTHLLPDIERTANYVVVMSQGKRVMQGTLNEILSREKGHEILQIRVSGDHEEFAEILTKAGFGINKVTESIITATAQGKTHQDVFNLAKNNNMYVRMISPFKDSLEDVFIEAVAQNGGIRA